MKLNNTRLHCCIFLFIIFNVFVFNNIVAQSTSVCPIGVPMEPKKKTELKAGSMFNEIMFGLAPTWTGLSNMRFADDKKAELTLNGITRSRQILGNNFKFQIPEGATINGIMLMVEGSSQNHKNIDEVEIFLLDRDGEPKGHNKSNQAKLQKAWSKKTDGSDHSWMYGASDDKWGTSWTPADINDPDFGFQIQIRNIDNSVNKVAIDQITILVDYTPAYSFCDDNCLTFYIDPTEKYARYEWLPVPGFRLVSHTYNHQTIDLKANGAKFGLYNVCVNVYDDKNRFVEKCCRNFLYQDCNSSDIQGIVWLDLNDNDLRDPDDKVLTGTSVFLFSKDNKPVDTVLTDATGRYTFSMVVPGDYYIKVPELKDKKFVFFKNTDPDFNSDITEKFGKGTTDLFTVEIGRKYEGIDLGYKPLVSIGDFVWEDKNYNGLQDSLESGLSGIKVFLLRQNLSIIDSTVTDQSGKYKFENVNANKYRIRFSFGNNFRPTWVNASNTDKNSKIDTLGLSGLLTFLNSEVRMNIDAGFYRPAAIGDLVWEDRDGNGRLDPDESGLPNVRLTLTGLTGDGRNISMERRTNSTGKYLFAPLAPGKYDVRVHADSIYRFTKPNIGDDSQDSDVVNGKISDITLNSGDSLLNNDAGLIRMAKIGDFVWDDVNANGIQDVGEVGISGVTVTLAIVNGDNVMPSRSTVTNDQGYYVFDTLSPGTYNINIRIPTGTVYNNSPKDKGTDDTKDSDFEPGKGINVQLLSGEDNLTADIGLFKFGKLGDFVWEDKNVNGIQDANEPGIMGVTINLSGRESNGDTINLVTSTDAGGKYLFDNLKPGKYHLKLATTNYSPTLPNLGSDDNLDSDAIDGLIADINILGGQADTSRDFGLVKFFEIGDYVWEDQNANGIQDANELPVARVEVMFSGMSFDNKSIVLRDTTDALGKYQFNKLIPGNYKIRVTMPEGYSPTKFNSGNNKNIDSDLAENGAETTLTITESINDLSIDFGLLKLGSIGDLVWEDLNCDNQKQLLEPGLKGVSVRLSGKDVFNMDVQQTILTDSLGFYNFTSLKPGNYNITFTVPQGYESTDTLVRSVTLVSGDIIESVDMGFYRRVSLGDYVWNDANSNGIQDVNESPMANVTVTLSGVSNASFMPQQSISNTSGLYKFENLKPGTYKLSFGSVADFRFTNQKAGTDTAKDSDVDTSGMADNIVLVSGVSRTDIDAGYVSTATGSIGDFVWEDLNGNGLQDSNEPGKAGVSIMLSGNSVSGAVINKTVITDANGKYKIDSLSEGTYVVTFKKPEGYLFTQINPTDSNKNSDADPVSGSTTAINLQRGQVIENIDAGLYKNATIGDFVWDDQNSNGVQDSGEPGLANVNITLTKSGDPSFIPIIVTSDTTGKYRFENVKPGSYNIVFGNVPLKRLADDNVGADRSVDSDPDNLGNVSNLSVSSGAIRNDIDAGYVSTSTASIGGYVWEDINANGIQESGEPGIVADSVFLRGESANVIGVTQSTLTDQNGRYIFSNLQAGTYSIRFGRPTGYQPTDENIGTDDKDSDADKNTGLTQALVVETGQTLRNIDAGFWRYGSIGDFVWKDLNKNGIQELGEPGIQGIVLVIKDETGNKILSDTSDVQGNYLFQNLKPGKYTVEATIPSEYKVVPVSSISPALNSDFTQSGAVATTTQIILVSNNQNLNIDLGLQPSTSTLRGLAWKDTNGNGLKDDQELGIDSVIVHLLSSGGDIVSRDTTNSAGEYRFDNIDAGSYRLSFAKKQNMYFTYADQGSNDNFDSDVIDQNGLTSTVTIAAGQEITHVFAGYVDGGSIGDFVWTDTNKDGLQNTDEVGLNGVKIYLLNESGNKLDSAITTMNSASSGYYKFSNLLYGNYKIKFALPQNFEFTSTSSSDTLRNSDISEVSTGMTSIISLLPGQNRTDIDAGLILMAVETGSINGTVWQDNNNNKFRDAIDSLLAGVTVTLHKMDGTIVSTTTSGANGSFTFSQLQLGDYYISVPVLNDKMFVLKQNPPLAKGSAISNKYGQGSSDMISVLSGTNVTDIDPGYFRKISIGDFVWEDLNVNGLQDTLEPGLQGVQISLINESGVVEKTVVSDSNGKYLITDVGPGRYKLKFSLLNNFVFTVNTGSDQNKNSKPNPITGESAYVDFINQTQFLNMDAGFAKPGSVGSRVWLDLNGNGIYQSGEPGLSGIKVKLFTEGRVQVDSTTTSTNPAGDFIGFYTFKSVSPGKYYVKFEIPDSLKISVHDIGEDDDNDSDITDNFGPLTTDLFEVMSGQFVKNIDAGAYKPATIGDRVWNDLNKNGVQEQGEPGVANVIVRIFNQSGTLLETTSTNAQGLYSFNNLRQRLYYLQFSLPAGFQFTQQNTSGSSADDSDVDNTGTTPLISLAHGVTLLDIDAGIHSTSSRIVIGTIWKDANEDGLRNLDELYENGVNVHIRELTSGNVKSAVTNHAGRYAFVSDNIGEHVVVVEAPEDHVFSKKGVGNNPDIDSDVDELGVSDNFMLADKYMVQSIDAGYYPKIVSSLSGKVWKDKNGNNLRDDTDSLIQDLVVFLFNKSRVFIKSTKTNSKGEYSFKLLDPGQYYCRIPELPDMDYVLFTGKNTDTDSEITHQYGIGTSRLITLEPGIGFENFDFGYRNLNKLVVTDPKRMAQYEVFPNPVINEIRVKIPQNENQETSYFITNNQGSIVNQGTIQNNAAILEIAHLPSGRYTIHFINKDERILKTFIKIDN